MIDRTRRGTHDRADGTEPCRGRATAASCRAASRTSRSACPCPVLLCTMHIGGANWKSGATCDSPVLPRSPKDDPTPSGQRRCRTHPEHCCKLQAEAIRGCNLVEIAAIAMVTHNVPSEEAFQTHACAAACWTRASRMHGIKSTSLAGSPAAANRPAEAARCFEVACEHPDARLPSAICRMQRKLTAHTAGPYQYATNASFMWDGRDLLALCASLPPCRGTSRGRMRGVGATCTAPTTHGRP